MLSRVYSKELSQEFLKSFRTPIFLQLLEELGIEVKENFKTGTLNKLLNELAIEYTRLFIGPGRHIYPYESAYCSKKREMPLDTASQMKNLVESHGLKYSSGFGGNFDHISIELEFMRKITDEEAKAWKRKERERAIECLKLEKQFIDEHLSEWVPVFSGRIVKEASLNFYREMAKLTKEYILLEAREIKNLEEGVI